MTPKQMSSILHHKYSMDDGHVTAQISGVNGYRGIMLLNSPASWKKGTPFNNVLTVGDIKKNSHLLRRLNVSGAHIHHGSLAPRFLFLKEKYNVPLFIGFRGKDATAFPKNKANLKLLKKVFLTGDLFLPVCEHLKREIIKLGCPSEKIRVLYGGVDLKRFEHRPRIAKGHRKIRFLAIGRFVEKKGFTDLIRAFALLRKKHDRVKLTIIGEGPLEREYLKWIRKLELQDSIRIIPWVNYRKIHDYYYRSHIFCAPSCTDAEGNQEGIPNTLKEAMATGMPVISTLHAGIPELVIDGVNGLLVPERSVDELANAMIWLAEHREAWNELGAQARKKIERDFHLQRQLEKQKDFYDEVLMKSCMK